MEKERQKLINEIKTEKNNLAVMLNTTGVAAPRRVANSIFGWYIVKGIYDKNFTKIRKDLEVKEDFSVLDYMGKDHLEACLDALKKYNLAIDYKQGIPYSKLGKTLQDIAIDVGMDEYLTLKEKIENRTGRRTSVYGDLLRGIRDNIIEKSYFPKKEKAVKTQGFVQLMFEGISLLDNCDILETQTKQTTDNDYEDPGFSRNR